MVKIEKRLFPLVIECLTAGLLLGEFAAAAAHAADDSPNRSQYLRYCGSCHGPSGRGDGILSSALTTKPADLTQIARKNGGEFPTQKIVAFIDGRNTVRAHGDPDMPVWGEVLREEAARSGQHEAVATSKLHFITDYIKSIQEK